MNYQLYDSDTRCTVAGLTTPRHARHPSPPLRGLDPCPTALLPAAVTEWAFTIRPPSFSSTALGLMSSPSTSNANRRQNRASIAYRDHISVIVAMAPTTNRYTSFAELCIHTYLRASQTLTLGHASLLKCRTNYCNVQCYFLCSELPVGATGAPLLVLYCMPWQASHHLTYATITSQPCSPAHTCACLPPLYLALQNRSAPTVSLAVRSEPATATASSGAASYLISNGADICLGQRLPQNKQVTPSPTSASPWPFSWPGTPPYAAAAAAMEYSSVCLTAVLLSLLLLAVVVAL